MRRPSHLCGLRLAIVDRGLISICSLAGGFSVRVQLTSAGISSTIFAQPRATRPLLRIRKDTRREAVLQSAIHPKSAAYVAIAITVMVAPEAAVGQSPICRHSNQEEWAAYPPN